MGGTAPTYITLAGYSLCWDGRACRGEPRVCGRPYINPSSLRFDSEGGSASGFSIEVIRDTRDRASRHDPTTRGAASMMHERGSSTTNLAQASARRGLPRPPRPVPSLGPLQPTGRVVPYPRPGSVGLLASRRAEARSRMARGRGWLVPGQVGRAGSIEPRTVTGSGG